MDNNTAPVIIRLPEVARMIGLSRATIYNKIKRGTFPASIPLSEFARGWLRSEVEAWIAERVSKRDGLTGEAA